MHRCRCSCACAHYTHTSSHSPSNQVAVTRALKSIKHVHMNATRIRQVHVRLTNLRLRSLCCTINLSTSVVQTTTTNRMHNREHAVSCGETVGLFLFFMFMITRVAMHAHVHAHTATVPSVTLAFVVDDSIKIFEKPLHENISVFVLYFVYIQKRHFEEACSSMCKHCKQRARRRAPLCSLRGCLGIWYACAARMYGQAHLLIVGSSAPWMHGLHTCTTDVPVRCTYHITSHHLHQRGERRCIRRC